MHSLVSRFTVSREHWSPELSSEALIEELKICQSYNRAIELQNVMSCLFESKIVALTSTPAWVVYSTFQSFPRATVQIE